jgi:hypothetical protein
MQTLLKDVGENSYIALLRINIAGNSILIKAVISDRVTDLRQILYDERDFHNMFPGIDTALKSSAFSLTSQGHVYLFSQGTGLTRHRRQELK